MVCGQPIPTCKPLSDRVVVPVLESSDRAAAARAMNAILQMKKIDVQGLRAAYEGVPE
jgi:hypothetical protein